MDTDKHRFCKPRSGLGSPGFWSLFGEENLGLEKPVSERLSFVLSCVYLWLH